MQRKVETSQQSGKVWLRIDREHIRRVIKARRDLCWGETIALDRGAIAFKVGA